MFDYKNNQIWINCAINKFKLVDNYATINFIKDNIGMKFDVVVGNPPFNSVTEKGGISGTIGNKTLYRRFVSKAFEVCKPNGIVALITLKNVINTLTKLNKQIDLINYMTSIDYWNYNTLYFIGKNSPKISEYTIADPIICKIVGNNEFNVKTQYSSLMQNRRSNLVLPTGNTVLVKLNGETPEEYADVTDTRKVVYGPKFAFTMLESIKSYTVTDKPLLAGCVRYISTRTLEEAEKLKLFTINNKAFRYFTTKMKGNSHAGMPANIKKFDLNQIKTGFEYPIEWNLTTEEIAYIEEQIK